MLSEEAWTGRTGGKGKDKEEEMFGRRCQSVGLIRHTFFQLGQLLYSSYRYIYYLLFAKLAALRTS